MKKRLLSLVVIGLLALVCTMAAAAAQPDADPQDMAMAIAYYTNQYRVSQGLPELVYRTDFQSAADIRAQEITVKYSHERPNGNLCWEGLMDYNWWAAENCIKGTWSAQGIVDSWIKSDGHRANLLSAQANGIAVGVVYADEIVYVVQTFIRERPLPEGFQPAPTPSLALTGGQVYVGVRDENGYGIEGATVTVKNSMGQTITSTTSWSGRTLQRLLVTDGTNTVTASKAGYISDTYTISIGFLSWNFRDPVLKKAPEATPTPTVAPTPSPVPTAAPTQEPTAAPTAAPTTAPTAAPTARPTPAPTVAPTAVPTTAPTAAPTVSPTAAPTAVPTPQPTATPTATPTPTLPPVTETGAAGFVTRLYNVCLGRQPDASGKASWAAELSSGRSTGTQAAYGFVFSTEFKNKNYCNSDYVKQLYRAFMGREADPSGLAGWVKVLEHGTTREEVFNGFATSAEFSKVCRDYNITSGQPIPVPKQGTVPKGSCAICGQQDGVTGFVNRMYQVCLNRTPDPTGLSGWTNSLWSHASTGRNTAYGFVFSNEFKGKNYSNADYVEYLYNAFMGRASDPGGKAAWVAQLDRGVSREEVFDGFAGSQEFTDICNSYGIVRD